jgi:tetraacyldisaccharide 4'-kinase
MQTESQQAQREAYLLSVIHGERRGVGASLLRGALGGLAWVYAGGLKLYLLPYRMGVRKQAKLPCPVISVGNLTVGGTGKTPMTQSICEFLQARSLRVCVLSRGYRGANEHGVAVVSTPKRVELDAAAAGDEAYLLAKLLPGVPVVVGKDRRKSGALACRQFQPQAIVLDDGMQFYQLHRDLEIVLVDAQRPFDNGWTLPRGLLREPPSHLRRAGCVVITHADRVEPERLERLKATIRQWTRGKPLFTAQYVIRTLRALDRSGDQPPAWLSGRRVASFCALGNPAGFEEQIERAGGVLVYRARFPDHYAPTMGELNAMIETARAACAEAILVSEKDAVKLPPLGRPLPFYALTARLTLDDESAFFSRILQALG